MTANGVGHLLRPCAQGQTADVVMRVFADFVAHLARAFDHGQGVEIGPRFGGALQVLGHLNEPALAPLNAPVVVGAGTLLKVIVRLVCKVIFQAFATPFGYHPVQVGVVGFEGKNVVGMRRVDIFSDGLLAAHGINGDYAVWDGQELQELRDRRYFIGFFICLHLPQQHAVLMRPCAHQVQR